RTKWIMTDHDIEHASTTAGLPVSPALGPALQQADIARHPTVLTPRSLYILFLAMMIAAVMVPIAKGLVYLIGLITNIAFYGRISGALSSPADNHLGYAVIAVPVIGSIIVCFMARYGSQAIRGHGIPEAMEQILTNDSN